MLVSVVPPALAIYSDKGKSRGRDEGRGVGAGVPTPFELVLRSYSNTSLSRYCLPSPTVSPYSQSSGLVKVYMRHEVNRAHLIMNKITEI